MMRGRGEWKVNRAAYVRVMLSLVTITRCASASGGEHPKGWRPSARRAEGTVGRVGRRGERATPVAQHISNFRFSSSLGRMSFSKGQTNAAHRCC
jgi:hypothetical protein